MIYREIREHDFCSLLPLLRYFLRAQGVPAGVMFHSEQCSHYTSRECLQALWRCRIKQSLSWRDNCRDNAPIARFFRTLKTEQVPTKGYNSFSEAQSAIIRYIMGYITVPSGLTGTMPACSQTNRSNCTTYSLMRWPVSVDHYNPSVPDVYA